MRPLQLALLLALPLGCLPGCSGAHEPAKDQTEAAKTAALNTRPVLDVPPLLAASIDELARTLGPRQPLPEGFIDPTVLPLLQRGIPIDSAVLFRYRNLQLIASYNERSRRLLDVLLLGPDEELLLRQANLTYNATQYVVLPVFKPERPTELMGLRVVPHPEL